jgi:hypothetical protein
MSASAGPQQGWRSIGTRPSAFATASAPASTAWAPPPPPRTANPNHARRSLSPPPSHWLTAAVKEAVRGIDDAPFLLVPRRGGGGGDSNAPVAFLRHPLPPSVVAAPALWPGIASVVSDAAGCGGEVGAVMLVHPLAGEEEGAKGPAGQPARPGLGAARPLAGLAPSPPSHHHHHLRLADTSMLVEAGLATAELAGRVGEPCCDEEEEGEPDPSALHGTSDFHHPAHAASAAEPGVAYYGVVVLGGDGASQQQQHHRAGAGRQHAAAAGSAATNADAGCYVLKTVRSPSACGCACVYFTLTRVTRGEPLAAQLASSWLA